MDQFFDIINQIHPLSKKSIEKFREILTKKTYPAKYKLCKFGQIPKRIAFLKSGIARAYMISPKGSEYNKTLFTRGNFIASYTSLITNSPSLYTIECLTDCTIVECDYSKFIHLVETLGDLGIMHRKNVEALYIYSINRNIEFLTLDATERYINLQKRIPSVDSLISQKQIANNLAITPIQLSRIKGKLLKS